jgi:hypothetical protein
VYLQESYYSIKKNLKKLFYRIVRECLLVPTEVQKKHASGVKVRTT